MKTLRAITLVCALLLTSATGFAGDGILSPGADRTSPPPPTPPSSSVATDGQDSLLLTVAIIWLQLRGISI